MKTNETNNRQRNTTKRLCLWAAVVGVILTIPFLANAPWTGSDFIFAGVVLFGSATVYELATRNMKNTQKVAVASAVLLFLVLVQAWAAAGP